MLAVPVLECRARCLQAMPLCSQAAAWPGSRYAHILYGDSAAWVAGSQHLCRLLTMLALASADVCRPHTLAAHAPMQIGKQVYTMVSVVQGTATEATPRTAADPCQHHAAPILDHGAVLFSGSHLRLQGCHLLLFRRNGCLQLQLLSLGPPSASARYAATTTGSAESAHCTWARRTCRQQRAVQAPHQVLHGRRGAVQAQSHAPAGKERAPHSPVRTPEGWPERCPSWCAEPAQPPALLCTLPARSSLG